MTETSLIAERVLVRSPWLRVRQCDFAVADEHKTYTMVDRQDAVVVLPLTASGHTLILQQFRFPTDCLSWELPMGGIEPGEEAPAAGRRELLEETRLAASRIHTLATWHPVPGLSSQRATVLVAEVTREELAAAAAEVTRADDIRACRALPLADLLELAAVGDVTDGFTLTALLYARLHRLDVDPSTLFEKELS